jgi:hypothetical protein
VQHTKFRYSTLGKIAKKTFFLPVYPYFTPVETLYSPSFFAMKKLLIAFFIILSGCKSEGYLVSPNDVHKAKVILYTKSQGQISGYIDISMEYGSGQHPNFSPVLEIMPEGKTAWQKLNINDITAYSLGSDYYPVKMVDVEMNGPPYQCFVKRLTAENSKIQLYELYQSGKANYTGDPTTSYYLSFPGYGPQQTINAKGSQLVPNFDLKMSSMVEDCPALAKKIRKMEKGYFLNMATFNIKTTPSVLMRIINEYDSCNLTGNLPGK